MVPMPTLTFRDGRSTVSLTSHGDRCLLVVQTVPHPGSLAFMRQLARKPWLTSPDPEEQERRMVDSPEEARRVLGRHGVQLTRAQEDDLARLFGE